MNGLRLLLSRIFSRVAMKFGAEWTPDFPTTDTGALPVSWHISDDPNADMKESLLYDVPLSDKDKCQVYGYLFAKYQDGLWVTGVPKKVQSPGWKIAPGWTSDVDLSEDWAIHIDDLEKGIPDEIDWDADPLAGAWGGDVA